MPLVLIQGNAFLHIFWFLGVAFLKKTKNNLLQGTFKNIKFLYEKKKNQAPQPPPPPDIK